MLPAVVQQHAEESALLRHVRSVLVRAPHVDLLQLGRLDERIAAHLDGLTVAGAVGTEYCRAALESPGAGEVFALAVRALESRDTPSWRHVLALASALPEAQRGVASALGWVSPQVLQGVVQHLLASPQAYERALGLAACRMHRVNPGDSLAAALSSPDTSLRAAAWRCAGELGRTDLRDAACAALADDEPEVAFQAAWAACLLGDRGASIQALAATAQQPGPLADRALALALIAAPFAQARELARQLSKSEAGGMRRIVRAVGLVGDARSVPWLLEHMEDPALARLAGESLSWITGVDLAREGLETLTAPPMPERPGDDPEDEELALDEDESLPWPDVPKLRAWWARQAELQRAASAGTRLFAGAAVDLATAQRVLRDGSQRLRALAALWRCVLQPGRALFPVAAPAPRQRQRLAARAGMSSP